jgi:hypothetical protein
MTWRTLNRLSEMKAQGTLVPRETLRRSGVSVLRFGLNTASFLGRANPVGAGLGVTLGVASVFELW